MKVILRADVENLGKLGDVVTVRPGYGRNYLLPQGMAMQATAGNLKAFELERKKLQARMDALRAEAGDLAGKLSRAEVVITMRVGENDKLYGSVTSAMISEILESQGIEIDRRRILLDAPIRTIGEFPVRARLHADVIAEFTVKVQPEERHIEEDIVPAAPAAVAEEAAEEAPASEEA
ncbi:50S ribosomal protein L9 [Desulfovibrio sp. OttesenSCG-928-I05]|nr:50S ribosomal protein L9 [Desulfovibrio sp. OttesenSCG-928-I05]